MVLMTLNTWVGCAGKEKLLSFFAAHKESVDIFCLQEVLSAPYEYLGSALQGAANAQLSEVMTEGVQEISVLLNGHTAYFRPHRLDNYGLMMLVKKNLPITEDGEVFVYKHKGYVPDSEVRNHARNIQYVTIEINAGPVTVINFHGLWNGKGKTDTEDRLNQSKNILAFIGKLQGEHILCGDFNLLLDTGSIKMLESFGLRNLIREYGITSTRTSFYTKPERHADYIFVSKGIVVKDFQVLPDEVSDHAPLLLEFEFSKR